MIKYYRYLDIKKGKAFVAPAGLKRKGLSRGAEERNPKLQEARGWKVYWKKPKKYTKKRRR